VTTDDIPEKVKKLIQAHITSIEQLEVLLFLVHHTERAWDAAEVSRELYIHPESAANRLADLQTRGFIQIDGASPQHYQYRVVTPDLHQTITTLADLYKERWFTIIDLIFAKPSATVQSFAEVFRIKKKK
jgi:hypothetical protein